MFSSAAACFLSRLLPVASAFGPRRAAHHFYLLFTLHRSKYSAINKMIHYTSRITHQKVITSRHSGKINSATGYVF
jgi:hypothetical protein